jgi:hypothetical protein
MINDYKTFREFEGFGIDFFFFFLIYNLVEKVSVFGLVLYYKYGSLIAELFVDQKGN